MLLFFWKLNLYEEFTVWIPLIIVIRNFIAQLSSMHIAMTADMHMFADCDTATSSRKNAEIVDSRVVSNRDLAWIVDWGLIRDEHIFA